MTNLAAGDTSVGSTPRTVVHHNPFEFARLLPVQAVIGAVEDMRAVL